MLGDFAWSAQHIAKKMALVVAMLAPDCCAFCCWQAPLCRHLSWPFSLVNGKGSRLATCLCCLHLPGCPRQALLSFLGRREACGVAVTQRCLFMLLRLPLSSAASGTSCSAAPLLSAKSACRQLHSCKGLAPPCAHCPEASPSHLPSGGAASSGACCLLQSCSWPEGTQPGQPLCGQEGRGCWLAKGLGCCLPCAPRGLPGSCQHQAPGQERAATCCFAPPHRAAPEVPLAQQAHCSSKLI